MELNSFNCHKLGAITLIISILFLLGCPQAFSLIGCEENDDYLHCFNEGAISQNTYFNTSSGYSQMANELNRTDEVGYYYGLAIYALRSWRFYSIDVFPGNTSFYSDNATYYYAQAQKAFTSVNFISNNSQNLKDDYVSVKISLNSSLALSGDYYFIRQLKNFDIGSDGKAERFTITYRNGSQEDFWNYSGIRYYNNVTEMFVTGSSYGYHWSFTQEQLLLYNKTGTLTNPELTFIERIGNIISKRAYNFTHYWIDESACVLACGVGCIPTLSSNISNAVLIQGQLFSNVYLTYGEAGIGCTTEHCPAFLGDPCYLGLKVNKTTSTAYSRIFTNNPDYPLKCANNNDCRITNFYRGTAYNFNVSGSGIYRGYWQGALGGASLQTTNKNTSSFGAVWANTTQKPGGLNVTLYSPADSTPLITNTTNKSVYFRAEANNLSVDNCTLYFNNTLNYTAAGNLSNSILFDNTTSLVWACRCCYSNLCQWNWNNNRSLLVWLPWFNVQLWWEPNTTNITSRNNSNNPAWINLSANMTGTRTVDNASFYLNNTLNRTFTTGINWSINLTGINLPGVYYWDILVCKDGNCRFSYNGNWTFLLNIIELPISQENPTYLVKSHPFSRSIIYILIGLSLFIIILLAFWRNPGDQDYI